jgi:hypothetical protein
MILRHIRAHALIELLHYCDFSCKSLIICEVVQGAVTLAGLEFTTAVHLMQKTPKNKGCRES